MKSPVERAAFLMASILLGLPLCAQDDSGGPPGPSPQNGPYVAPSEQGAPAPDQSAPDQSATFQTFYDGLGQQGTWIQSSDYGYVWQPTVNDANWAPYTAGHWVYSDAGWTWVSDEPWGWATYHYGRWVNLDGTGWCWVPGYTWAPAWVSWRFGGGYCGWAPLPPDSFVGIDYADDGIEITDGFHIGGDCDSYYGIGAGWYNFVPVNCLGYSNYRGYYANRYNNYAIINGTTNVTSLYVTRNQPGVFGGVTTGGPSLAQVNAVALTPVQRVALVGASQPGGGRLANNSLALYAPRVNAGVLAPPAHVAGTLGPATINRGVNVTQPLAVTRSLAAPAPTSNQIQQAQLAQFNAPPHARVVTTNTPVQPVLQTPLVAMKPIAASPLAQAAGANPNSYHGAAAPVATAPSITHVYNNNAYTRGEENAPNAYVPGTAYPQTSSLNRQQQPAQSAPSNGYFVHSSAPLNSPLQNSAAPSGYNPSSPFSGAQGYHGVSNGNSGGTNGWGNHGGSPNGNNQQQQNH